MTIKAKPFWAGVYNKVWAGVRDQIYVELSPDECEALVNYVATVESGRDELDAKLHRVREGLQTALKHGEWSVG